MQMTTDAMLFDVTYIDNDGDEFTFMTKVPGRALAQRIADALKEKCGDDVREVIVDESLT